MTTALLTAARNAWPFKSEPLQIGIENDIPWAIADNGSPHTPALCGYAQIPAEGHPWCTVTSREQLNERVTTPGGITWGPCEEFEFVAITHPARTLTDVGGWIGFDTGHAWDRWSDAELAKVGIERKPLPNGQYLAPFARMPGSRDWTVDAIISEARDLARQIAAAR